MPSWMRLVTVVPAALALTLSSKPTSTFTYVPMPTDDFPTPQFEPYYVTYGNDKYQSCGFTRRGYIGCPKDHACIDDPVPSSCGQACDALGVCLKLEGAAVCGTGVAACANNGRCERVISGCIQLDGDSTRCLGLCFPDYWDGEPDAYPFPWGKRQA